MGACRFAQPALCHDGSGRSCCPLANKANRLRRLP